MPQVQMNLIPVAGPEVKVELPDYKAAIVGAIKDFEVEEKDQEIQTLCEEIRNGLGGLLAQEEGESLKPKVVDLRTLLEKAMRGKVIARNTLLGDKIFNLQLSLTHHWPRNEVDDAARYLDIMTLEPFLPEESIDSSHGLIYHKASLQRFFREDSTFQYNKNVGFSVMRLSPGEGNLPVCPNSAYVLVQAAPGVPPTAVWFVDRTRNPVEVSEVHFPEGGNASTFASRLFPATRNHLYPERNLLSEDEKGKIVSYIGSEQIIKYRSPEGTWFGLRDIKHFRAAGIEIPERDQALFNRLGQNELRNVLAALGFNQNVTGNSMRRMLRHYFGPLNNRFSGLASGLADGFVYGSFLGLFVGIASLISFFSVLQTIPLLGAMGAGLLGGVIESRKGNRFGKGFFAVASGSIILTAAFAYLVPLLLPALGVVSASTLAASAIWSQVILPCIPLVIAALAGIREYFKPDSMKKFYDGITSLTIGLPVIAGGLFGMGIGATLGLVFKDLPNAIGRCMRPRLGIAEPAANPSGRRLSVNAEIHQALPGSNNPSPRTQAAMQRAMFGEDSPNAVARLFSFDPVRASQANHSSPVVVPPVNQDLPSPC